MVTGTVAQNVSLLARYVSTVKSLKVRELEPPGTLIQPPYLSLWQQSTTLEKNTGAAGEPTVANTHTVQSLEIGYDNYNRVNRLVQRLEGSKTKTTNMVKPKIKTNSTPYVKSVTVASGRTKVANKVKKSSPGSTKFRQTCMA